MFSFLPEWVSAMEIDGDSDLRLARWEDADPVIRMIIIFSFVLTQFPKAISTVKIPACPDRFVANIAMTM